MRQERGASEESAVKIVSQNAAPGFAIISATKPTQSSTQGAEIGSPGGTELLMYTNALHGSPETGHGEGSSEQWSQHEHFDSTSQASASFEPPTIDNSAEAQKPIGRSSTDAHPTRGSVVSNAVHNAIARVSEQQTWEREKRMSFECYVNRHDRRNRIPIPR